MNAQIRDGWLEVPYTGSDRARLAIATGQRTPAGWRPAYLDAPRKVAKVRPPKGRPGTELTVWLRVDGQVTTMGRIKL